MKNRIIDHKELHPETKRHNTLFYAASSLDWQELIHKERGMQSVRALEIVTAEFIPFLDVLWETSWSIGTWICDAKERWIITSPLA